MTDQAPWTRHTARHGVSIVGEFENEHGERFVIYRNGDADGKPTGDKLYVTGDEFDWQPRIGLWPVDFMFGPGERLKIAKILWPDMSLIPEDSLDDYAMRPAAREMVAQIVSECPGIRTDLPVRKAIVQWQEQHPEAD